MNQNALAISLSDSLGAEVTDCLGDIIEAGIDSVMDEGLLQGVPFISTVVSLFRIGRSIHERHQIKKLASFVDEIRRKTVEADKLEEYRQEFLSDEKKRNSELEYIMIIVDRYVSYEKPRLLAALYLAYLDGNIEWTEFTTYAEVVDRLLPTDIALLRDFRGPARIRPGSMHADILMRLSSSGILYEKSNLFNNMDKAMKLSKRLGSSLGDEYDRHEMHEFEFTHFGSQFVRIIKNT